MKVGLCLEVHNMGFKYPGFVEANNIVDLWDVHLNMYCEFRHMTLVSTLKYKHSTSNFPQTATEKS